MPTPTKMVPALRFKAAEARRLRKKALTRAAASELTQHDRRQDRRCDDHQQGDITDRKHRHVDDGG